MGLHCTALKLDPIEIPEGRRINLIRVIGEIREIKKALIVPVRQDQWVDPQHFKAFSSFGSHTNRQVNVSSCLPMVSTALMTSIVYLIRSGFS